MVNKKVLRNNLSLKDQKIQILYKKIKKILGMLKMHPPIEKLEEKKIQQQEPENWIGKKITKLIYNSPQLKHYSNNSHIPSR